MKRRLLLSLILLALGGAYSRGVEVGTQIIDWTELPDLPDRLGVAGAFSGVSGEALIVAGGANFPVPLFKDGQLNPSAAKVWLGNTYVLAEPSGKWREVTPLARPLAYGASVTIPEGLVCIGGGDAGQSYAEVFMLVWSDGRMEKQELPPLPKPCSNTAAALLDTTIYVAGGQESPDANSAMHNFWALDLSKTDRGWRELAPWPGPERILPVAAVQDGSFFLFSGCRLLTGQAGRIRRQYLKDAYRFTPAKLGAPEGLWKRIADVPVPVVGAPSPAIATGQSHILIFGGDSGQHADRTFQLADRHPGFSTDILAYHTITDTWVNAGVLPAGHVTTPAVKWGDTVVIPSGEVRPGTRSPKILSGALRKTRAAFAFADYATWILYLAVILCMGFYFAKREKGTDDFFLAGRRVPWWAAGVSVFGTQLSAITFMAIPAKVYATDWVYILAQAAIILVAPIIVLFYLPFFRRLNLTTAYQYLERRFNLTVRLFGGVAFCLMQLGRMAIVLFLPALALSTVANLNIFACILLMGILCTIYTVLGGIEAVIWTDVLQVIVLMGGALLCTAVIISKVDGGLSQILYLGVQANKFKAVNLTWDYTTAAVWVVLLGNIFSNLVPYSADQAVVQRYLTTRTERQAANAVWTNAVLTVPAALIFFFLGTALYAFYRTMPAKLNPTLDTDAVLPWFVVHELPAGLAGIILAAIFAASMSSLDSSMNSMATVVTTDFYHRFKPNSSDHTRLLLARIVTVVLGLFATACAVLMALYPIKSIWDLFMALLGLLGGSVAGVFALGIFTTRANAPGALVGILSSIVTLYCVRRFTDVHFFLYGAVGIITCLCAGYLASMIIPTSKAPATGLTVYEMRSRRKSST
ncbi:MAG: sodium/solute symporter [Phycisphaerales bacterium]|nr:MAG: sodium/solute symporter [Phycisphaerales bacterium]